MSLANAPVHLIPGSPPRPASSRVFDWLLTQAFSFRPPPASSAILTTAVIVVVGVIRSWLFAGNAPWFLFVPTVLVIALLLGRKMGVWATVLSALMAGHAVWQPGNPWLLSPVDWTATIVFLVTTLGIVALAGELRAAFDLRGRMIAQREADLERMAERESFLSSVLASSPDCIKVLDLDGKLTFMSDGGQKVMEVSDFNAIRGCPWPDFWQGAGNTDAMEAVQAARRGETRTFIGKAETMAGTPKWWNVAVSPIFGSDGRPERILSVSRDITAMRTNEEDRDRLARLVEASTDFIGMSHLDGTAFFLNNAGRRLVGLDDRPIETVNVLDFFAPAEAERMTSQVLPAVDAVGHWTGEIDFRDFQTGEAIPVLCTIFAVEAQGRRVGYATVTRDYREHKRAERQREVMTGELSHRMKNMMTLVQAMADQTLRGVPDRGPVENLTKRLQALSSAHSLLLGGGWEPARIMAVVTAAVEAFGQFERIHANGPEVMLGARTVVSLSLLLHEFATNATKYGALSNDAGEVFITWEVVESAGGPTFVLHWREEGGPPVVEPSRKGFGSRLIRAGLIGTGGVELRYAPAGLEADMTAPLAHMQEA